MEAVIDKELAWSNLKETFEKADLPAFKAMSGDAETFANLQQVETWGREAKRDFSELTKENRTEWVAQEVEKVWLERQTMAPELKPPTHQRSLSEVAHERVDRKIEQGYAAIDQYMRTEQARLVQQPEQKADAPTRLPAHPLKKTNHEMIDQIVEDLTKVYAQYEHNRDSFIQNAYQDGVPNPQGAFDQARADAVEQIRSQAHSRMHTQFVKHGIDRAPERAAPMPSQNE
ncbi:MAG: hypothetical protein AAFQ15_05035 [Pseudomonadota bacterium]